MNSIRIFISSVRSEFAQERRALRDYLLGDPLLGRFFDVFLFEDVPASDRRPDELYLHEVERCDLYVGLFGGDYGAKDAEGYSPTEREFDRATERGVHRLIFLKNLEDSARHPKMQALIGKVQSDLIRRRFHAPEELQTGIYAALVEYLEVKELIRPGAIRRGTLCGGDAGRSRLGADGAIRSHRSPGKAISANRRSAAG